MVQFDRQYRLAAGVGGEIGFVVGGMTEQNSAALHIRFTVDKCDAETPNTATISLWNLNPAQLATLNQAGCLVTLRAGYGNHRPLIFAGAVTYVETSLDNGDRETYIEVADGQAELQDSYVSLSYSGLINTKAIIENIAANMGVAVSFSYNTSFADLSGFSFVGAARVGLDKACASSGLQWGIQNGILQIKRPGDTMTREVYLLNAESGLLNIPKKITYAAEGDGEEQSGYEVEYLLNGAIGIGDYIRLESKVAHGYFRIRTLELRGDNLEGDWICTARLINTVSLLA